MEIPEIIKFLRHPDTVCGYRSATSIDTNFDLKPADFLRFAETDLAATYDHALINALSNAKRALDCQLDTLLIGFGFYAEAKSKMWGFPKKVQKIKELGIIAPRVLNKINRTRNLMEHQFTKPNRDSIEDFVDIASLFLGCTDKYIYDLTNDCEMMNEDLDDFWIAMELDIKKSTLKVAYCPKGQKRTTHIIKFTDPEYLEILKVYLEVGNV